MSVGCVVVVPNNRNILEIVENNFNGIVYDQEKDSLKDIIQNIENRDVELISQNAIATIKKIIHLKRSQIWNLHFISMIKLMS